jgi:hypothetical protein
MDNQVLQHTVHLFKDLTAMEEIFRIRTPYRVGSLHLSTDDI